MTKDEIIAKARKAGIELNPADVIDYGEGWTIDGVEAEEWLRAMTD